MALGKPELFVKLIYFVIVWVAGYKQMANFFNGVVIFIFILFVEVFLLLKRRCGQLHTFKHASKIPLSVYNYENNHRRVI